MIDSLRAAYDGSAARRDGTAKTPWKLAERAAFLGRLRDGGCGRLLEIGAGPGQDSAYFRDSGLEVVAADLSPEMVALCRAKGLDAHVMDFLRLDFPPGSFDAVYALNCLLHVPDRELPAILDVVHTLLRPGGLFFLGVYGGGVLSGEGPFDGDDHQPPRFFSFRGDEQLKEFARQLFEIVDFHVVGSDELRFQSLTLRRP
ncbi:class I SAM-dependent methyltransferase [Nonomuraea zeae]|uniref:class I SAM-dependent methyltransferase n=1 Tax=Nonomuraea zeae TaxID=1642303 RepID=UPI001F0F88C5|nr:class I SAM-dependent methyltransferase [Nonomuraea zeae]